MRCSIVATAALLTLTLASCNENQPAKPETSNNAFLNALKNGKATYSANVSSQQPTTTMPPGHSELHLSNAGGGGVTATDGSGASSEPAVQIPADARWSLYCASAAGPDRFTRMKQYKEYLTSKTPFKNWYVVHNEHDSTLFYGFYPSVEKSDPASARAHDDRKRISEWKDADGQMPFATCFFTPITPPTPPAPAEWSLSNAPARAYWSVEIAAFRDNPMRKVAAVEMVKEMRAKGIPAFFYHGPSISSVCVGTWPADAVKQQDIDGSHAAADQDDAVLVSPVPLPDRYKNAKMKTADGQRLVPYAQRVEIADPSLTATFKEYPYHYVNYEAMKKKVKTVDGTMQDRIAPSLLVTIPRDAQDAVNNNTAPAPVPPLDRIRQQQPGTGQLPGVRY